MTAKRSVVRAYRKDECETDGLYFTRFFMKKRIGSKMIIGRHHAVMQAALDRTMLPPDDPQFIPRLIINVPPGYTKTEMAAINYMARGLAVNPRSRFLHMSYSQDLALLNSATTREIVRGVDYQAMWPMSTKDDADSKSTWWTTNGGGVRATAAGGQITGFRAGHMLNTEFTGAMLIDDPNKPDDAHYPLQLETTNNRYSETSASRLAIETVPIILIMQRIAWLDLSGYLLMGGSGEMWHHLNLPVIIDNSETYPKEYTHSIPITHGLKNGWLWPYKHNEAHEVALKSHRRKYTCQYQQKPRKHDEEHMVWQESDIRKAHGTPFVEDRNRTVVSIDPAASNTKTSDEHGIGVASSHGKDKYTVNADYTRKGTPKEWADAAIYAYETHKANAIVIETNQGGDMATDTLRNAGYKGVIIKVHAAKGKVTRAEPIAALYAQNYVRHAPGLEKLEEEQLDFDPVTGLANGRSPNRVDWCVWALTELSKKSEFRVF